MIEGLKKEKYNLSNSLLLYGKNVPEKLPESEWKSYCDDASAELWKYRSKVNVESSSKLQDAVTQGRGIILIDLEAKKLLGFAQIKRTKEGLEFSSWLGLVPGVSRPILMTGSILGFEIDPYAQVVARVREGNSKAEKIIRDMGGKFLRSETSDNHFNPDSLQPFCKSIFNISLGVLQPRTKDNFD